MPSALDPVKANFEEIKKQGTVTLSLSWADYISKVSSLLSVCIS